MDIGTASDAVDLWTLAHVSSGVASGLMRWPAWLAWALFVAYEMLEAVLRLVWVGGPGPFAPEALTNVVADVLVAMGGWGTVRLLTGRVQAVSIKPVRVAEAQDE